MISHTRSVVAVSAAFAAALLAGPTLTGQSKSAAKSPAIAGGNGTMYIGTYKGELEIYDEATETLVGAIKLKTGLTDSLIPSPDRSRFYVVDARVEQIEVIDIASRTTIDSFKLTAGNKNVRILNLVPDPANRYLILLYRVATKHSDRWEIGPATIQQYDLGTHQFGRVIPWPKGDEREFVNLRIGPDGKHLFIFDEDEVTVLETTNFTEVETWPFGQPDGAGLGRIRMGPVHDFYDAPGTFTGLFTMQDAQRARRIMGVGRVDLTSRTLDFRPLGPTPAVAPSFAQAPDHKRAYGVSQAIGDYEFWTFDLEKNAVTMRTRFDGRPRMGVRVSSNGKLFYVFVAGATLDVYEAATHKYLRTIWLGGDQTTELFVIPGAGAATSRSR